MTNWEKNRTSPHFSHITKIIEFLGYAPDGIHNAETKGQENTSARGLLGLSQKKLARRLGVDPSTLGRWERDETLRHKELFTKAQPQALDEAIGERVDWRR